MTDTIYAVSSGAPPAAIAVVRISGAHAFAAAQALGGRLPEPRRAGLRRLRDPATGETLDHALVLLFPGPESATGEDIAELHLHGGRAVVRAVEAAIGAVPGCRPAEAGEFTRRALEAGRIDLTEAEGLADLLAAETEGQRRAALRSADGSLRRTIEQWTTQAVGLAAMIEAAIDHSDEADAADEAGILATVQAGCRTLADDIAAVLAQPPVERLRDGIRVALVGPPNSGKSTLFNAMVGRDAAIVSPIAGTTRDRIEAPVVRDGIAWLLTDTAGLAEQTDDPIEAIGIARTRESAQDADIVLWLGDDAPDVAYESLVLVHPRSDLPGREQVPEGRVAATATMPGGEGEVWRALAARAEHLLPRSDLPALNERQRGLCRDAQRHLCDAAEAADPLILADDLRQTCAVFDRITGRAHVEAVLDALFGRFCIGK